ncbi:hypothetical protein [Nocardioides litoris]|uniref:hypothetical protein n=1 Tax=Nocardioides litoris TaxID=1926648 RepID=UPI0011214CEC|nr:hypothetical protein [Nocardioides litoris]
MTGRLDPDQIPDDADGRDLARYVGEDLGRHVAIRVAVVLSALCILAGATTDADPGLRSLAAASGAGGFVLVLGVVIARAVRRTQWTAIVVTTLVCGTLLAAVLVQQAS